MVTHDMMTDDALQTVVPREVIAVGCLIVYTTPYLPAGSVVKQLPTTLYQNLHLEQCSDSL